MSEKEQRKLRRLHIICYLRVFDRESAELVGHIADISTAGMMLVSDRPLELDTDYRLVMELPLEGNKRTRVLLTARSIWSRRDANPDFYNVGFKLKRPSVRAVQRIKALIDEFTQRA